MSFARPLAFVAVAFGWLAPLLQAGPAGFQRDALERSAPPAVFEQRTAPPTPPRPRPTAGPTLYSIGEPTDAEQSYLELLNRARKDPAAEGIRLRDIADPVIRSAYYPTDGIGGFLWIVDTNLFATNMAAIPPTAPLAFHSKLIDAARGHSQWMLDRAVQSHDQDGVSTSQRITATGYNWETVAENVFAFAQYPDHGFAAFEVDWGEGPHGMQEPPGHRNNDHNGVFYEVGIGVVRGSNSRPEGDRIVTVGPELVTVDFGTQPAAVPLVTGVAYYDVNQNGFYDEGEGLGGVRVDVSGSSFYAVTSASGGYAVPTANGPRTVSFTASYLAQAPRPITVAGGLNQKVDLILPYTGPSISGPTAVAVGQDATYSVGVVAGATGYELRTLRREPYTIVEGAEQGPGAVEISASPGYAVIDAAVKTVEGTHAFHLAHPNDDVNPVRDQIVKLRPVFRAGSNPRCRFASRLGYATDVQVARAQVSTDHGVTWSDVWSQSGTGGAGEVLLTRRSISLAALSGREFQVRFVYSLGEGSYFPQTNSGVGFYVDEIAFDDVEQVTELGLKALAAVDTFTFRAPSAGNYGLVLRPTIGARSFPYGSIFLVGATVDSTLPVVRLAAPVLGPNGKLRLDFSLESGALGTPSLEGSTALGGTWSAVAGAVLTTNSPGSFSYRFTPSGPGGFLRVRAR